MNLLSRETWKAKPEEEFKAFAIREAQNREAFRRLKEEKGVCFVIRFGEDDYRPMWEVDINPNKLREEIRAPDGLEWLCPLCQPYDAWYGRGKIDDNRRYFTRIIQPNWYDGCMEENGTYAKCVCLNTKRVNKFRSN